MEGRVNVLGRGKAKEAKAGTTWPISGPRDDSP